MQTDKKVCPLGMGDAFDRRAIAIIAPSEDDSYIREAGCFQGDQMGNLYHYLFLYEVIYPDSTSIVAPMPRIYGDYPKGSLAFSPYTEQAHHEKPQI
jgi:hypothetical protein